MRFKCVISYDGTNFHGFQKQSELRTIQEEIEKALKIICKQDVEIYASGRTDKGVHALGQVIHFDTTINITPSGLLKAINSILPSDIYVKSAEVVDNSFHARYSSQKKEYHYLVDVGEYNPLLANYRTYYMYKKLDYNKIIEASKVFIGTHDFRTFTKNNELENTVRTIYRLDVIIEKGLITFKFLGSGFLHNQVRIITAMILEVARGKMKLEELKSAMEKKDRKFAPKVLGASGLYLYEVFY